jgi:two-component system, LytTR family, response regulator
MNILIVDDEPLAREGLRREIKRLPGVGRVEICGRRDEAIAAIVDRRPDVALLDVQLGRATAFDIIEEIGADAMPLVIFVTAYERHALKAFEVHALDYVLKPIDPDRLREAIDRAASILSLKEGASITRRLESFLARHTPPAHALSSSQGPTVIPPVAPPQRLVARDGEHLVLVEPTVIEWIASAGNYVTLHCGSHAYVMRSSMDAIERRLVPTGSFIRLRRSTLVNVNAIARFEPYAKGMYLVRLRNGQKIISSRYHQNAIRSLMRPERAEIPRLRSE